MRPQAMAHGATSAAQHGMAVSGLDGAGDGPASRPTRGAGGTAGPPARPAQTDLAILQKGPCIYLKLTRGKQHYVLLFI